MTGEREWPKSTLEAVLGSKERYEAGAAGYGNFWSASAVRHSQSGGLT